MKEEPFKSLHLPTCFTNNAALWCHEVSNPNKARTNICFVLVAKSTMRVLPVTKRDGWKCRLTAAAPARTQ